MVLVLVFFLLHMSLLKTLFIFLIYIIFLHYLYSLLILYITFEFVEYIFVCVYIFSSCSPCSSLPIKVGKSWILCKWGAIFPGSGQSDCFVSSLTVWKWYFHTLQHAHSKRWKRIASLSWVCTVIITLCLNGSVTFSSKGGPGSKRWLAQSPRIKVVWVRSA